MRIGTDGWLTLGDKEELLHAASPHFDCRPANESIGLIVIHNISLPAGSFGGPHVENLFMGRMDCQAHPDFADLEGLKVSAHFFIRRDGQIIQFVGVHERAWHAGESSFMGKGRCNDFSIGIELEGTDTHPFEAAQYRELTKLCVALSAYLSELQWICGHSDIAPKRKTDPGPHFDWPSFLSGLQQAGLTLTNPFLFRK